jgi:prepilin-type processing-associated H-X9-DG protein
MIGRKLVRTAVAAVLALWCVAAWGQAAGSRGAAVGAPPAAAFDGNAFMAPFVDEQTIAVAHLDVGKIDTGAIETYVKGLMDEMKMPAEDQPALPQARKEVDAFLAKFKQAGGRHVVAVLSHADIWPSLQPLAVLVKVEPGGDAKAMLTLLMSVNGSANPPADGANVGAMSMEERGKWEMSQQIQAVMLRDDVVFVGQAAAFKRLQTLKPARRPELTLKASEAALEAVGSLTNDERRALKETMPTLPAALGGGSTDFLTRDALVVRVEVTMPPKPAIRLTYERMGGAGVEDVTAFIGQMRELALQQLAQNFKAPDQRQLAEDMRGLLTEVLTPRNGALTLEDKQVHAYARILMPSLGQARENAMRVRSATNIRQILIACLVYANDNKDALPESLDQLVRGRSLAAQLLTNPRDEKHRRYVYRRGEGQLSKMASPATTPLVWEEADDPAAPRNVGYADGHVEWVADRAQLSALTGGAGGGAAPAGSGGLP